MRRPKKKIIPFKAARSPDRDIQPYVAGQSSEPLPGGEDFELINDCSICFSLQEAATALGRISTNIKMCSLGSSKKKEFGLEKSFVDSQISTIKRMMKFHQYFHACGEALSDSDFGLPYSNDNPSPPNFKRFRPK